MRALALATIALAVACSTPATDTPDAGDPFRTGLPDPRTFDCTSLGPDGGVLPARASPIPVACGLDPTCRTLQVSGHRGVGGTLGVIAPEDTLAAYRAAIALGIEYGETDPRPTADGVLVNMHDTTVDRTTDGTGTVSEMTFAEIRALKPKSEGLPGDYSCEKIPTLTEVLQTCRGRIVALVDANKTNRVDLLVKAIQDADAIDWALFDTSDVAKIDEALRLEPRLHFMIRPDTADIAAQLEHFAPRVPSIVEIHGYDAAPIVHAKGLRVLSDVFVADVAAGYGNDVSGYVSAIEAGVDILQTDRPDLVRDLLHARGAR